MDANFSEANLQDIIKNSPIISDSEKRILLQELNKYTPMEKLKLRKDLLQNIVPIEIVKLRQTKDQFEKIENPGEPDILTKISNKFSPPKKKPLLSTTVLQKTHIIGSSEPKANQQPRVNLAGLDKLTKLEELNSLTINHISFNINDNSQQIIQNFLNQLTNLFNKIENIDQKRSYLMDFLQSPLFLAYLNTGITALRHPEIQPSRVILNSLNHINTKYLNNKQFQVAAKISGHIRSLVAL